MPADLTSVRQQALELDGVDRQMLIHNLVASFDAPELTEVDEAWLALAETRLREIENGKETIQADEVFAEIRRERGW